MEGERFEGRGSMGTGEKLPKNEIFDLMSSQRRRYVIHYCKRTGEAVTLSDLAEQVAAWEQDKKIEELTSDQRKTVYTSLQQTHIPRLERAGVLTESNGVIELTDEIDKISIYLDFVPENSIPWSIYYLGLSSLAFVVMAALWIDILPTDPVPTLVYPTLIVGIMLISASCHAYLNHKQNLENFEKPP
ncbi:hypothetical protein [Natrinema sp. CBA1119]|uniref:DUF7344 domain-containing protein n=1 Tax=Natrinema sp. CBA1119 TaxID=1608465 RepID=UPI0020D26928|nr:hypothetical protein [Natrinema sp. CBA1119]